MTKKSNASENFSFDFRNMKFTGSTENATINLIICWVFFLVLVLVLCWFLKAYVVPILVSTAGGKLIANLGKLFTYWKGGRSP